MEVLKRTAYELIKFEYEVFIIVFSLLVLVATAVALYWFYHRRKFRELSHQIPASVVNNYLDSIIQNSNALKSSLFRNGEMPLGEGIPSVVPVKDLSTGDVSVSGASSEELTLKNAEIAALGQRLAEKEKLVQDLEKRLLDASSGGGSEDTAPLHEEISNLNNKIVELEAALASAQTSSGEGGGEGNAALEQQLSDMTAERDELKEKLMEYEIIEEDLANLKRLQQENDQLRSQLAAGGGEALAAPIEEPVAEAPAEEVAAEAPAEETVAEAPAEEPVAEAPAEEVVAEAAPAPSEDGVPANEGEQKSAEELLSEFEKMLG